MDNLGLPTMPKAIAAMAGGKIAAVKPIRIWTLISEETLGARTMPTHPPATNSAPKIKSHFFLVELSTSQPAGACATTLAMLCAATTMPTLAGSQCRVAVR